MNTPILALLFTLAPPIALAQRPVLNVPAPPPSQTLPDAAAILDDLQELGVQPGGARPIVMPVARENADGTTDYELEVAFLPPEGSASFEAENLVLFESAKTSYLVLTYLADETKVALTRKSRIVKLEARGPGQRIAAVLRERGKPGIEADHTALPTRTYSARWIQCWSAGGPGGKVSCKIAGDS